MCWCGVGTDGGMSSPVVSIYRISSSRTCAVWLCLYILFFACHLCIALPITSSRPLGKEQMGLRKVPETKYFSGVKIHSNDHGCPLSGHNQEKKLYSFIASDSSAIF